MRVVFDAVAVRPGSAAVVGRHLVDGWAAATSDSLVVLVADAGRPPFPTPPGVAVATVGSAAPGPLASISRRTVGVRRACAVQAADLALSLVTASALAGTRCRRGVIVHDLRHEVLPDQFGLRRRVGRRVSYGLSFRRADVLICNSERTRRDLLSGRPGLAGKAVVTPFGSDHVEAWPAPDTHGEPYALAFGSFANKNAESVVRAWSALTQRPGLPRLRVVGIPDGDRQRLARLVDDLGLEGSVELMPWLDDDAFTRCFAGARVVVFPSDFEGFGLPAVEAMRLRIPLVVSDDAALLEVCAGHAVVVGSTDPAAIADGVLRALDRSRAELDAGAQHAGRSTWRRTALAVRAALLGVPDVDAVGGTPPRERSS